MSVCVGGCVCVRVHITYTKIYVYQCINSLSLFFYIYIYMFLFFLHACKMHLRAVDLKEFFFTCSENQRKGLMWS